MAAELGSTSDPKQLVPGNVAAIADSVWSLRAYGDSLTSAGQGLARIDTAEGWSGPAGDNFRRVYDGQPSRWTDAGDAFHGTADALDGFADTLDWAQRQAAQAIHDYDHGNDVTTQAKAAYDADVAAARAKAAAIAAHGGQVHLDILPFEDPGEAVRQQVRDNLSRARTQLRAAGDAAETVVATGRDKAPQKPGLLSRIGHAIGNGLDRLGHGLEEAGADVVNALASTGNAMLHHPGDTALTVFGMALAGVSGAGEGAGVVLDATGVGAVVGVPLNIVSAAGMAAGGTMAVAGARDLAAHAAGDDAVEPVKVEDEPQGASGQAGTKTDQLKEHLTDRDLDAARRESNGEVVARKTNGDPWDHVNEIREAQQGLLNQIQRLQRRLGDSRLSEADRQAAQSELSEASRLLDHSKSYLPMK